MEDICRIVIRPAEISLLYLFIWDYRRRNIADTGGNFLPRLFSFVFDLIVDMLRAKFGVSYFYNTFCPLQLDLHTLHFGFIIMGVYSFKAYDSHKRASKQEREGRKKIPLCPRLYLSKTDLRLFWRFLNVRRRSGGLRSLALCFFYLCKLIFYGWEVYV